MRLACCRRRLLYSIKMLLPEAVLEEMEKVYEVGKHHKSPKVFSLIAERLQVREVACKNAEQAYQCW